MSAPFLDREVHAQRTNLKNKSVSYYNKGEDVAIELDLLIRGRTKGRASLDDVLRRMYDEFYLKSPKATYYLSGRGFTAEDFQRVTSEVAGQDMSEFFQRYVRGVESPPYQEAFGFLGLRLVRYVDSEPFSAGITLDDDSPDRVKIKSVRNNSPAETAGLQQDDEILSLGDKTVSFAKWLRMLNQHKKGDRIPVKVRRDRKTIETTITLGDADRYDYRIEEIKDATPEMRVLRAAWLGNRE